MAITGEESEDHPPGFTLPYVPLQIEAPPRRPSITLRPQHGPVDAKIPVNFPSGSGNNLGDSPINLITFDLDMMERERMATESLKQLEDCCRWLEEKFKVLESADGHHGVDAKELSLVPNLVLPHKFKMPEFEKYNGTTCPEAHITMFCRRMTRYVNNDQLLIHCFQDSLVGAAASITLQNMEKKLNENFRQYAQRWKEVAMQVQPPLLEKEITITTKSFTDIVVAGEMIENAIRGDKIEGEAVKRSAPRRKDNEVNNTSSFNSKAITVGQPKVTAVGQQGSQRQESGTSHERMQFTPIPVMYRELYQSLYNAHAFVPFHLKPLQSPHPKWYDANAKCEYHAGISGHSIENCTGFKKAVERLIKMGVVKFYSTPNTENPLPNHDNQGVNAIGEASERRMKENVTEVRMPMKVIWEEMMKRGIITSRKEREKMENYCEFHGEEGHETQNCEEFRALVQGCIDNKELQIFEGNNEVGTPAVPKVIIHKPTPFPYKDSKRVPWNYDCSVTVLKEENIASASKDVQVECSHTRSGKRYDTGGVRVEPTKTKGVEVEKGKETEVPMNEPVNEEEAKEFLKLFKHSEYSVVEPLRKQLARISVLALLLSSEVHREALMKVLNETYVTHDISVNKLDRLVNNISADNFIYFNDDEIPPEGRGSTKALHITTRCKGYTLQSVLVDNGSALNVLPLSTLNRLSIDDSHMKTCQNVVRAFDGTESKVIGRIDIRLEIGLNMYEVGKPWIHSAGAAPSSLHQKLKLVIDGRLIAINTEEEIIAAVTSKAPYVETNKESIECSFCSLEFANATSISEGSELPVPRIARATRMALQMMARKGALPGRGLGKYLQGGIQIPKLIEKKDRFGLGFKPDYKQRRKDIEKRQERRRARLDGREVGWELITFPPISKTFISRLMLHTTKDWSKGILKGIGPYESGSSLNNWTVEELPVVSRNSSE
ncbi:uncharacterized protein LOC108458720 [Gossypium arboreum]|uniref:uncharacterized protein LOC108458720 n=1 Tax=Gossypium arboreum TaxID=29729 RepID=UPI0008191FF5|nr:uncharacterized protein LOC108458720 [Gossypium arboreum]